jgi:hypothetical protein
MNRTEASHGELHDAIRELRATVIARLAHIRGLEVISDQVLRGLDGRTNEEAFETVVAPVLRREGLLRRLFRRLFRPKSAPEP